jgi:hypothetical protein
VDPAPEEKIERILAIGSYVETVIGMDFLKRLGDQLNVGRIVFH